MWVTVWYEVGYESYIGEDHFVSLYIPLRNLCDLFPGSFEVWLGA
jgi:hypothetical protein